jgi:hypothetical protein
MVTHLLSNTPMQRVLGTESSWEDITNEVFESAQKAIDWRASLNLNMSIASRGTSEGVWYMDLLLNPQTGWREIMANMHNSVELFMSVKNPEKILFFSPDLWSSQFIEFSKRKNISINFVNNQSLYNFETFLRDHSMSIGSESLRDTSYGVVEPDEIGDGEASGFDLIQVMGWDVAYDIELLEKCIGSLSSGGVLLINSTNNSGKIYRDDYNLHPLSDLHEVLKFSNGSTFHNSESYGYTAFVKD